MSRVPLLCLQTRTHFKSDSPVVSWSRTLELRWVVHMCVRVFELGDVSLFSCGFERIQALFFFPPHMLIWINDAIVTKASALWDLTVLHCNKRESGQAPSDSVVLRYGSGQAKGECMRERWMWVCKSLEFTVTQTLTNRQNFSLLRKWIENTGVGTFFTKQHLELFVQTVWAEFDVTKHWKHFQHRCLGVCLGSP